MSKTLQWAPFLKISGKIDCELQGENEILVILYAVKSNAVPGGLD